MPTNPVTLADLLPPITADQYEAILLATLQGIGPVEQIGQGGGSVAVTGSPLSNYDASVLMVAAGAPGTATFRYSLDNGLTYTNPIGVPSNGQYAITGTGLTLAFAGTFVAGDQYLFQTVFPVFPVTNFQSGSAALTFIKSEAAAGASFVGQALANIAAGGFVDYASDQNAPQDWLTLLSAEVYENQRAQPGVMMGQESFSLASTASPITVSAGDLIVSNSTGTGPNVFQYSNASGFTINPGQTLSIPVTALAPGAGYNLANGSVATLITPRPGLTATNPAPGTSAVTPSGGATGTLTVTGSPNGNYSVAVRVLSTGVLGVATAQASLDGGTDYGAPFTIPASGVYALPLLSGSGSTGLTLQFAAGTWTNGDSYSFTSYTSWILTPGLDMESSTSLRNRDKARWPTLGVSQGNPSAVWTLLCQSTPNGGSEVTKVNPVPDLVVGGQLNITVAGPSGPVSAAALSNISTFVAARAVLGSKVVVQNATVQTLVVAGTVYVVAAQLAAAQAAISVAFQQLAAATQIQGVVTFASIETAIENQSASGVTNVHVTSPAPNVDTQLNANSTVQFDISGLTYVLQ